MSVFYPSSVGSQGKDTWVFVVAIASTTAMTTTEFNASTGVILQNAMRPGFGADAETERITDERQGSLVTYDQLGTTKVTLTDMILIDRPQTAAADATRDHLDTLIEGTVGYLINRRGLGSAPENWVAAASGQKYVGYPVTVGAQVPLAPGDSKAFEVKVSFAVTGAAFKGAIA